MDMMTANWRKSSYSGNGGNTCVELAVLPGGTAVRDSTNPGAGHLPLSADAFRALLTDVKQGRHDL